MRIRGSSIIALLALAILLNLTTSREGAAFFSSQRPCPLPEGMVVHMGYEKNSGPFVFLQSAFGEAVRCSGKESACWGKITALLERDYGEFGKETAISAGSLFALANCDHRGMVRVLDKAQLFPVGESFLSFPSPNAFLKENTWRHPPEDSERIFLVTLYTWEEQGGLLRRWVLRVSPNAVYIHEHEPPFAQGVSECLVQSVS